LKNDIVKEKMSGRGRISLINESVSAFLRRPTSISGRRAMTPWRNAKTAIVAFFEQDGGQWPLYPTEAVDPRVGPALMKRGLGDEVRRETGDRITQQVANLLDRIEGLKTHYKGELKGEPAERLMRACVSLKRTLPIEFLPGEDIQAAIGAAAGAIRAACAIIERSITAASGVSEEALHYWLEQRDPSAAIRVGEIGRVRRRIFRQGHPPLEQVLWVSEAPWARLLLFLGDRLRRLEDATAIAELELVESFASNADRIVREQGGIRAIADPLVEALDQRWFRLMKLRFARDPWLRDPSALPALLLAAGAARWSADGAEIRGTSYLPPGMLPEELRDLLIRFELWPGDHSGGAP
jgi:hypothetical protein